jgi:hypothetical protein
MSFRNKVLYSLFCLITLLLGVNAWVATNAGVRPCDNFDADVPSNIPVVQLWPDGQVPAAVGNTCQDIPRMAVFVPTTPAPASGFPAVIIAPGGAYKAEAADVEGTNVAAYFQSHGVVAFVLRYRLPIYLGTDPSNPYPYQGKIPYLDMQRAIRWARAHSSKYHINRNQVGVVGFSAGGHLASTAETHYECDTFTPAATPDAIDLDVKNCRPDFGLLVYPVITMELLRTPARGECKANPLSYICQFQALHPKDPLAAHRGSRNNLFGQNAYPTQDMIDFFSSEKNVTPQITNANNHRLVVDPGTPPTVIVYSRYVWNGIPQNNDGVVKVANSEAFALSLENNCVNHTLREYVPPSAVDGVQVEYKHGFGYGQTFPAASTVVQDQGSKDLPNLLNIQFAAPTTSAPTVESWLDSAYQDIGNILQWGQSSRLQSPSCPAQ